MQHKHRGLAIVEIANYAIPGVAMFPFHLIAHHWILRGTGRNVKGIPYFIFKLEFLPDN
jgi:hypothetical protein